MERMQQSKESTGSRRTTQAKFTAASRESEQLNQGQLMTAQRKKLDGLFGNAIQRVEDEEPLQGKFELAQRMEDEELPAQGKFDPVQRVEEEEPLQGKFEASSLVQRAEEAKPNHTGLPDHLKSGIENLSGMSMDHVRVHYNSSQPAQLNALAYAQGTDIHVAPGQEQHLPHEAWHVVQQAQGRVKPTMQLQQGVPVNDDHSLEHEADVMGAKALQMKLAPSSGGVVQRVKEFFVPDVGEPHIHVHDGGITFTDVGHAHKYLVRGDKTLDSNVAELRKDLVSRGDERSLKLNRWIKNHIVR